MARIIKIVVLILCVSTKFNLHIANNSLRKSHEEHLYKELYDLLDYGSRKVTNDINLFWTFMLFTEISEMPECPFVSTRAVVFLYSPTTHDT